jgi:simple sugar transport system ATP-binding protein
MKTIDDDYILKMEHITKVYPNGFIANKDISFYVRKGEIHALAGENGAGKTTLMKILFGIEEPEEGKIIYKGKEVKIRNPLHAIKVGIGMVHQHFMLVPSLTVAENMVLGVEPRKLGLINFKEAVKNTREISEKYGLPIDPSARVASLQVGMKQRLEILKALYRGADILILDEPTSVLTPQETVEIFKELKRLRDMGYTIIFISHKLNEIKMLCDRVTLIRDGRIAAVKEVADVNEKEISRLMVGRDVELTMSKEKASPGERQLEIMNVYYKDNAGKILIKDISFSIRGGEILGIAGIEGNGQNELSELITGMKKIQTGSIRVCGRDIEGKTVQMIRLLGLSHIPQDRMTYGVVAEGSVTENLIADRYYKNEYNKGFFQNFNFINTMTDRLINEFDIRCENRNVPIRMLSGGNMQKVVVAREFSSDPRLIVANQPTRGIDVGAAELVHNKLLELRKKGTAVLLISADLQEILDLSDRLIVVYNGQVVAYFGETDRKNDVAIGEYMLGLKEMDLLKIKEAVL